MFLYFSSFSFTVTGNTTGAMKGKVFELNIRKLPKLIVPAESSYEVRATDNMCQTRCQIQTSFKCRCRRGAQAAWISSIAAKFCAWQQVLWQNIGGLGTVQFFNFRIGIPSLYFCLKIHSATNWHSSRIEQTNCYSFTQFGTNSNIFPIPCQCWQAFQEQKCFISMGFCIDRWKKTESWSGFAKRWWSRGIQN